METIKYGTSDEQRIDMHLPEGDVHGLAILVHGGFWRSSFSSALMSGLAAYLVDRGWKVANIEYRRTGTGGEWPVAMKDVRAAINTVSQQHRESHPGARSIVIGHSAGGHLALLAADLVDGVVALAPVTDMVRCDEEGLGEDAAREFMRSSNRENPDEYRLASPAYATPPGARILVVHGDCDERVPVAHSRKYVSDTLIGMDAQYKELENMTHRALIDPEEEHWTEVLAWMRSDSKDAGNP